MKIVNNRLIASKRSRRQNVNILELTKTPLNHKTVPSGHPAPNSPTAGKTKNRKKSIYGMMLGECIKIRTIYGNMTDTKLRTEFRKASSTKGDTAKNLFSRLERSLISVVSKAWASTPFHARQLISHKKIMVNDSVVNIKSYLLKVGDVITLLAPLENKDLSLCRKKKELKLPSYLEIGENKKTCTVVRNPSLENSTYSFPINLQQVIEYYSR
jgi:small subunit ribosomal protein S4